MNKQDALLVALNALQAIDDEHPYPIAKHAIVQISRVLAKPEPWDTSDMAHRSGGLSVEQEPVAWIHRIIKDGELLATHVTQKPPEQYEKWWTSYPLYTAPPKREWVGLDENDFEYQPPQTVLTMKFAEAILRDRNK
jgi:hypothetical protein